MLFSVWPSPSRSTSEIFDLAHQSESDGWYGFWYADHYMPNTGDTSFAPGDARECWAILAAVAAVTNTLRLGPLVSPTSVHHPALLANRAATIDHLSDGRFRLGLGAGWQINEHAAYGIELEAPGNRVSRFEESIQIIRSLLDNERTTFQGEFYNITDAPCDPKPVQQHLPITVGTGSPRMLKITARFADAWNTWGAPELAGKRRSAFEQACSAVDVDPATMHTSVQALFYLGGDPARADERTIAGSNEQIIDSLGQFAELGFDEVIVPDFNWETSVDERADAYRRFATEIIPEVP